MLLLQRKAPLEVVVYMNNLKCHCLSQGMRSTHGESTLSFPDSNKPDGIGEYYVLLISKGAPQIVEHYV